MFARTRSFDLLTEYLPTLDGSPPSAMDSPDEGLTDHLAQKIAAINYRELLQAVPVLKNHIFSTKGLLKLDTETGYFNCISGPKGDLHFCSAAKESQELLDCEVTLGGYIEQKSNIIAFHYNFEILVPVCKNLSKIARKALDALDEKFKAKDEAAKEKKRAFIYSAAFTKCIYPFNSVGTSKRMEHMRLVRLYQMSTTQRGAVTKIGDKGVAFPYRPNTQSAWQE